MHAISPAISRRAGMNGALAAVLAAVLTVTLAAPARAAITNIAQVPLLNISGTGSVKPNLMLLFDNSGSMAQHYTPDYINDNLCRSGAKLSNGQMACDVGHPPFMSPDFNRQFYNPKIRYQPPIKADGTYYNEQTAANTSNWTNVASDGFGVYNKDLYEASDTAIDLTTQFPDLKWCSVSGGTDCRTNSATYTYPDATYKYATRITTSPYYYTISVAEYCTDDTMTVCKSTAAGATAPSGYPVPAKVRWCSDTTLINCQAKRVGSYIYPRYSTASGATASYGTITIGASSSASSMTITSVTIPDPSTARTITNGTVTASTGTNSALKQQTLASALAASIIAKTGLTNQYYACVKTPIGQATVPACSTFGITLASDSVVAVVPVVCTGSKSLGTCLTVNDNSRSGWGITVTAPAVTVTPAVARVSPTALISVSGTTSNSGTPKLASVTWGGTTLASNISLGNNKSASNVVGTIVAAIGTGGSIKAYAGGNSVTAVCAAQTNTKICLVDTTINGNSNTPSTGSLTAGGSIAFGYTAGSGYVAASSAVTDSIPTTTAALSSGAEAPSTFVRVDLTSGSTYAKGADRVDCVAQAGVCTYAEEMTNFANWYSYYKSRLQMMKTAVGIAFAAINSNYRVGYVKLSNAGAGASIDMKPADFVGTSRTNWYSVLYNTTTSGSTPIRTAMDNVGKMFANQSPYNYSSGQEVVQYPCQPNFLILTTDGYWNGGASTTVQNNDNVENASRFCTQARGCVDPRAQTQQSISDVALYWYNGGSNTGTVSLRPTLEPDMTRPGQVPAAAGENTHLHMNTYTLGLGMDGVMTYEQNYDTAPKVGGDFYNLITGVASGCPWNGGGAYVWPDPQTASTASTVQERVDDLWHAAINGQGKYFSANEPKEVVDGLSTALANMQVSVGAAAAAATSTPNISQQDNDIFSDTFTTVKWYGELTDRKIDAATGTVGTSVTWTSSDTVGLKALTDSRAIYMIDAAAATPALKEFKYANLNATEKTWFDNKCTLLSQCTLLSASDRAIVNAGTNVVNWLRGVQTYADDAIFRAYTMTSYTPNGATSPLPIVLGDIASSKPAYMRDPRKNYTLAGYDQFKSDNANRSATVFTAANDGMMHAFRASNGEELWAYAPRITMKKLYALASTTYGTNHFFSTDGSPELGDVQIGGVWKTVMVAGLNGGGRGFYALDVTDPANPRALWELCADASICSLNDPDIGLSFGNAQFGMWQGRWVVLLTSGYNNVPGVDNVNTGSGVGMLYIVDVATGEILKKVSTGSGDTTTPSGFAKITAITDDPATDPIITYVYGGDVNGKLWKFDLTNAAGAVSVKNLADSGVLQPITTRPEVTLCAATDAGGALYAQRVVLFGTGRLLDVPDTTNTDTQSLYLIRDKDTFVTLRSASEMVQQTVSLEGSSSNVNTYAISNNAVNLATKSGWYFDWNLNLGERMNLDPKVVSGVANVVTNIPSSSSSCSVGGSSNVYSVNVCNGNAVSGTVAGGTLSNTSAAVGFIIIRLPKGELKMITTTAKGEMLTKPLSELNSAAAHRVGWRRVKTD